MCLREYAGVQEVNVRTIWMFFKLKNRTGIKLSKYSIYALTQMAHPSVMSHMACKYFEGRGKIHNVEWVTVAPILAALLSLTCCSYTPY